VVLQGRFSVAELSGQLTTKAQDLAPGAYILRLTPPKGMPQTIKLIK
jgi:hypothetical protein